MKKAVIFAVIIATAAMGAGALEWHGDVQAQVGWQMSETTFPSTSTATKSASYLALQTYQFPLTLHASNGSVSVGFFGKVDAALSSFEWMGGGTFSNHDGQIREWSRNAVAFIIGPAVGFNMNNAVAVQFGAGFLGGFENQGLLMEAIDYRYDIRNGVVGFAVDAQLKVLPAKTFSPVLGFQYAYRGMDKYFFQWSTSRLEDAEWRDYKFDAHTYAVYGGVSWNF